MTIDVPIRWIVAVERGLTVDADHDQLFRVLVNVARNAVQALEARGARDPARDQIRITGRREGSVVVIEVSDTGPGVSEKARAHLFQAFQGSTRTGGTGLGLAIAAELVRAHGGEIAWCRAPSARPSASPFPTARSNSVAPRRARPAPNLFPWLLDAADYSISSKVLVGARSRQSCEAFGCAPRYRRALRGVRSSRGRHRENSV